MNKNPRRGLNLLFSLLSILIVAGATVAIALLSKFYFNWEYPIGDEALALMGKMKFIYHNFPHINWNHEWDAGQPGFWIYMPFAFFVGDLFVKFLNLTFSHSITLLGLVSYICIAVGVYGITQRLVKNQLLAILAAFLTIISQGVWYWDSAGYYARTFGMGFYFLAFWTGVAFIQKIEKQGKIFPLPKLEFFSTVFFFFLAGYSHALPNFLTAGTLTLLFLVALPGWSKKLLATVLVIGTGILLAAFYFLLMIQASAQFYQRSFFTRAYEPHPWRLFWNLEAFEGYSGAPEALPLILPLVAVSLFYFIVSRWRLKGFSRAEKRILGLIIFFLIISLFYGLQGSLFLPKLFYIFMFPCDTPFFVTIFGAILISACLAVILRKFPNFYRHFIPLVILGIVAILTFKGAFFTLDDEWPRRLGVDDSSGFVRRMVIDPESKQYRMGTINPMWAESFNYFYEVSQSRDYFSRGVVYDDWQFWLHAAVWNTDYDYPETDFLIDWFSLKWILSIDSEADTSFVKFSARPEKYDLVYQEPPNYYEFIPKNVSPILSATNAPSILVIGKEGVAHDSLIRASAVINLNSQYVIPVKGKEYIDQYSLDELQKFSLIYLYEYKYKNPAKASQLLTKYVANGGGLIVEAALSPEAKTKGGLVFLEPLPQTKPKQLNRLGDWQFEVKDSEITREVDFNAFDRAFYEENEPWKIVSLEAVNNYEALVKSAGDPVVLTTELGEGRIVWMGLNLNYHITVNKNAEEMKFFTNLLKWASKGKVDQLPPASDYEAKFIHPERREIIVNRQSLGILNKEYYFPAWKAHLEQNGEKQPLTIYRGGLDQQYIPLPADLETPYKVVMIYGRWPIEKLGFVISGITLIGLIIYLFEGWLYPPFLGKLWQKVISMSFGQIKAKTGSWWDRDDEYK